MSIATHITLSALPNYDENYTVTAHSDGTALSRIFDLVWDFSGQEKGAILGIQVVNFKSVSEVYRKDIQKALATIMEAHKARHSENASKSQVTNWRIGLVHIRNFLESSDWASLSDDKVYKKFKRKLKKQIRESGWSVTTITNIIAVINKLNESTLCLRIPDGKEIRGWVSKEREQHIAIPIGMYQRIIASALKQVETYLPYRHAINDAQTQLEAFYQEESTRTDCSLSVSAIALRAQKRIKALPHSIPNFRITRDGIELKKIHTACAMVTLVFSGMRVGELVSMGEDSYKEVGGNHIPTLRGEETKRNGQVMHETWQTHEVAKDALELAYDTTQFLRSSYQEINDGDLDKGKITPEVHQRYARQIASAFVATNSSLINSSYCRANFSIAFNNFIQECGIVATQADVEEFNRLNPTREGQLKVGEALPKLTPHDFRRSFAVFFKRYGFGSSATIKFQYKHSNILMSDYYSNNARLQAMEDVLLDNDLLKMMNEEGIHMGVDIFDEIYNESEHLSGIGGERIAKEKFERLSNGEHIFMTRSEIEELVRNGTLSAVKLPTGGYCLNATCSRVCGIGEFSAEIKPCDHQVITDKQAKVILKQNKRLIKAFRDLNTGDPMMNSILIAQKQKLQRNEQLIKDFNLAFEPFSDKVKGIIETSEV